MNVALVTCIKNENMYLKEFLDYYTNLGVDAIYLIDNNENGGENVYDFVSQNYWSNNTGNHIFIISDFKNNNENGRQLKMYNDAYFLLYEKHDVLMFFDIDEYLWLKKDKDIHDYLSRDCFKKYDTILVNWLMYDDNDLIYYEDKPLNERFTRPRYDMYNSQTTNILNGKRSIVYLNQLKTNFNYTYKSIVFTNKNPNNIYFFTNHIIFHLYSKICTNSGNLFYEISDINSIPNFYALNAYWQFNESLAVLKHFRYKTIEEFIKFKIKQESFTVGYDPFEFFNNGNYLTKEKLEYLQNYI